MGRQSQVLRQESRHSKVNEMKSEQVNSTAVSNTMNSHSAAIVQAERDVDAICERLSKVEAIVHVSPSFTESLASLRERIAALETRVHDSRNSAQ